MDPSLPCTFANNDCTCGNVPDAIALQGCIAQACTVKEWLGKRSSWNVFRARLTIAVATNATDTICERPIRDQSHILIDVNAALGALALLALLIRVFLAVRLHSFGNDDFFACLAGLFALPHFVGSIVIANIGMGIDIWTIMPERISDILKVILLRSCQRWREKTDT